MRNYADFRILITCLRAREIMASRIQPVSLWGTRRVPGTASHAASSRSAQRLAERILNSVLWLKVHITVILRNLEIQEDSDYISLLNCKDLSAV